MQLGGLISGKYRLTRQICEGTMGVVWAAVNEATSREVALKLILRSTEELRQRLEKEARAAGGLRHRNIIEIYDVGRTDQGDPFLVMPLLTGETLSDLLERQRRLEPDVAAWIARDVARALETAHAGNIVHRDLKPANIFLHQDPGDEGPIIKVLDFGVSKNLEVSEGLTVNGRTVGSPAYMSPEQASMDRTLDHRADIWSLGVILFEMLTGVRPFKGNGNQIIPLILSGEIPRVSRFIRHIDPRLDNLVACCLERDRDKRIGAAAEVAAALERFGARSRSQNAFGQASFEVFGARAVVTPTAQSPRLDGRVRAAAADGEHEEDDRAPTMKLEPKMTAALIRRRKPQASPARRPEGPPPPQAEPVAPAAPSVCAETNGQAPRFGSSPGLPATPVLGTGIPPARSSGSVGAKGVGLAPTTPEVTDDGPAAPLCGPDLLGGSSSGSWLEMTTPLGHTSNTDSALESARETPEMVRRGSPTRTLADPAAVLSPPGFVPDPFPAPSAAPLLGPADDPVLISNVAPRDIQKARRRLVIAVLSGVWVGIAGLASVVYHAESSSQPDPPAASAKLESAVQTVTSTPSSKPALDASSTIAPKAPQVPSSTPTAAPTAKVPPPKASSPALPGSTGKPPVSQPRTSRSGPKKPIDLPPF